MKFRTMLLLGAAFIVSSGLSANAGDRYEAPPAAVLSSDLSSPWLLQLHNAPPKSSKPASRLGISRAKLWKKPARTRAPSRNTGIFANSPVRSKTVARRDASANSLRNASLYNRAVADKKKYRKIRPLKLKKRALVQSRSTSRVSFAAQPIARPAPVRKQIDRRFHPQMVAFETTQAPGTIIIDTSARYLYLVTGASSARRYGVGVGKQGFEWSGTHKITRKAEWPDWRPPKEMIERERAKGRELPAHMAGGPKNPLGARALYIGSTLYRIHGTNQPWTIGEAVSSGCIRMRNEDVMDLYERTKMGAKVIVS